MSKAKKTEDETLPAINSQMTAELSASFDALSGAVESGEMVEVTGDYISFEPGEVNDYIFEGFTTFSSEKGDKPAVILWDREGNRGVSASAVLVNSCKSIKPLSAIRVVAKDWKKSAVGKYMDLQVLTPKANYKSNDQRLIGV